jgi:hypothetical protein
MAFWRRRRARTSGTDFVVYDAARDAAWTIAERLRHDLPPVRPDQLPPPTIALVPGETQLTTSIPAAVFRWHHPQHGPARPVPMSIPAFTAAQALAARRTLDARERQWRQDVADAQAAFWEPVSLEEIPVVATSHRLAIATPAGSLDLWWRDMSQARKAQTVGSLVVTGRHGEGWWLEGDGLPPATVLAVWFTHRLALDVVPATDRKLAQIQIAQERNQRAVDSMFGTPPSG